MNIVLQRATKAILLVAGKVVVATAHGLLFHRDMATEDDEIKMRTMENKTTNLRILADEIGNMNRSDSIR